MSNRGHECGFCARRFPTTFEHMDHVMKTHDVSFKPRGQRLLRPVSCWRCASEMWLGARGDWFSCECGFELPRNWKNGQLSVDTAEPETETASEVPGADLSHSNDNTAWFRTRLN